MISDFGGFRRKLDNCERLEPELLGAKLLQEIRVKTHYDHINVMLST